MIKCTLSWFIAVVIASCSGQSEHNGSLDDKVISIDPLMAEKLKCSQLFDTLQYVLLETRDDALIAGIDKIEISDSVLYLLDRSASTVWMYSMDGRYLNRIAAMGRGKGEYISCTDICIGDNIKILDRTGQKIEIYDKDANYLKSVMINQMANAFFSNNDDQYWLFTKGNDMYTKNAASNLAYNLFYWDGGEKQGFVPYNRYIDNFFSHEVFNYCVEIDELLCFFSRRDTIYELKGDSLKYRYVIDFGKSRMPLELHGSNEIQMKPEYASVLTLLQSEKYLFMNYTHDNRVKFILMDKTDSVQVNCHSLLNDMDGISLLLCMPKKILENELIFVHSAYEIVSQMKSEKNKQYESGYSKFVHLKETDNPVLILGRLKNNLK